MNYFEYFSEIEERFVARRGSYLLLSTLDWALIDTWREAGVPLVAVLRGIDTAFDRYESRLATAKRRLRRINGLAWCAQAVMEQAVLLADAATGMEPGQPAPATGFEGERIGRFLYGNAATLERVLEANPAAPTVDALRSTAARLRELAAEVRRGGHPALDELDRTLTVLEERLQATVVADTPEAELLALREHADRELAPYRTRMGAVQVRQVREQFVHKRLFEARGLPRLSLFFMPAEELDVPESDAGPEVPDLPEHPDAGGGTV